MAAEIVSIDKITVTNGAGVGKFDLTGTFDQANPGSWTGVQNIGTSEEDIVFSGVSTVGFYVLQNLDDTNFIDVGVKVAGVMEELNRLMPGMSMRGYLFSGAVIRAKADTAACDMRIWAAEA